MALWMPRSSGSCFSSAVRSSSFFAGLSRCTFGAASVPRLPFLRRSPPRQHQRERDKELIRCPIGWQMQRYTFFSFPPQRQIILPYSSRTLESRGEHVPFSVSFPRGGGGEIFCFR